MLVYFMLNEIELRCEILTHFPVTGDKVSIKDRNDNMRHCTVVSREFSNDFLSVKLKLVENV